MLTHRLLFRCAWLIAAALLPLAPGLARKKAPEPPPAPLAPPGANGAFVDRGGTRHEWQVNSAFALQWDGNPYLPLGSVFTAGSLARPDDAAAWEKDRQSLASLKAAGVADVAVRPAGDATAAPAAAWQRLVDALEADGFRYGVALPGTVPAQASGYFVNAGSFRSGTLPANGQVSLELRIPGFEGEFQRVACTVFDARTGRLVRVEWAKLEKIPGGARASLQTAVMQGAEYVVEMTPLIGGVPGLPDLWSDPEAAGAGLDELAKLKWGPGLRFLTHPYAEAIRLSGAAAFVVPASSAYRVEFEAYLNKTYRSVGALRSRWAFRGNLPPTIEAAARLVPLTVVDAQQSRMAYLMDEKELRCYVIEPRDSSFWSDHLYFREHSIRQHLNLSSRVIRQRLADVPVVVARSGNVRHYHFSDEVAGGFAGLGLRASAQDLVAEGGRAIGEALLATTRPWCVALSLEGYRAGEALQADVEALRRLGVKGWFVDPKDASPAEVGAWLAACRIALDARADAAGYLPSYVVYPRALPEAGAFGGSRATVEATTRPLGENAWWVPTIGAWQALDLGADLRAYSLLGPGGGIYVWSREGKRRITVRPIIYGQVEVRDAAGKVLKREEGGRRFSIDLTEDPVVVTGVPPEHFVPAEVAAAELAEMDRRIKELSAAGIDVRRFQDALRWAQRMDPVKRPRDVHDFLRQALEVLRALAANQAAPAPAPAAPG